MGNKPFESIGGFTKVAKACLQGRVNPWRVESNVRLVPIQGRAETTQNKFEMLGLWDICRPYSRWYQESPSQSQKVANTILQEVTNGRSRCALRHETEHTKRNPCIWNLPNDSVYAHLTFCCQLVQKHLVSLSEALSTPT